MKNRDAFSGYHLLVNFLYFALVLVFAMFFTHPASQIISLLSAFSDKLPEVWIYLFAHGICHSCHIASDNP